MLEILLGKCHAYELLKIADSLGILLVPYPWEYFQCRSFFVGYNFVIVLKMSMLKGEVWPNSIGHISPVSHRSAFNSALL